MLLAQTSFFGYYGGYYGITGVIPCPGEHGGTKVGQVDVGFSGGGNARQIERGGVITGAADGDDSVGF